MSNTVDCALLVPLIERWRFEGGILDNLPRDLPRFCRAVLAGERLTTTLDKADWLLIELGYSPAVLNDISPLTEEAA